MQDCEESETGSGNDSVEVCDAEILDALTTSRGEFKRRSVSFNDRSLQVINLRSIAKHQERIKYYKQPNAKIKTSI